MPLGFNTCNKETRPSCGESIVDPGSPQSPGLPRLPQVTSVSVVTQVIKVGSPGCSIISQIMRVCLRKSSISSQPSHLFDATHCNPSKVLVRSTYTIQRCKLDVCTKQEICCMQKGEQKTILGNTLPWKQIKRMLLNYAGAFFFTFKIK